MEKSILKKDKTATFKVEAVLSFNRVNVLFISYMQLSVKKKSLKSGNRKNDDYNKKSR